MKCRGYSEALQRALTDFGADDAFARAAAKLKEHYGIEVAVSAIRGFSEEHGAAMLSQEKQKSDWRDPAGVPVLIAEMDGSMLPVVKLRELLSSLPVRCKPGEGSLTLLKGQM